ncbi:MAG: DUF1275 family protein [Caulobacteraceae bacterium]
MIRYPLRIRLFAAGLSALAGFVDAIGFIKLGGYFVSFMSGNSTRLAVALAKGQPPIAAGLIAAFVLGVILGALAAGAAASRHRATTVLVLVTVLLAAAAALDRPGLGAVCAIAMAMAMGAENGVFAADGEVHIGLTYMTGTLVKLGQKVAMALRGRDVFGWAPYLLLWFGLAAGAVTGAIAYARLGAGSLWIAAAAALAMTLAAARIGALDHHMTSSGRAEPR